MGVSDGLFYAVQGWTFVVGTPTTRDERLLEGTRAALDGNSAVASLGVSGGTVEPAGGAAGSAGARRPSRHRSGCVSWPPRTA